MEHLTEILRVYGLPGVFAALVVEGIGLPIPAYPLLVVAAALAPSLDLSLPMLLAAGMVATLLPDVFWYWAGMRWGTRIMGVMCRMSITPDSCARSSSDLFARVGPICLTFIKFVPGLSNLAIVLSGAARLRLRVFGFFDTIGGLVYIGSGIALGVIFHNAIAGLIAEIAKFGRWSLVIVAALFAVYLASKSVQRYLLLRRLRMDRITVDELAAMASAEQRPVILDVRPVDQRERYGMIPGAVSADATKLDIVIEDFGRDREVVVYCSCPNEISAARLAQKLRSAGFKKIRPLQGGIDAWIKAGHAVDLIPQGFALRQAA